MLIRPIAAPEARAAEINAALFGEFTEGPFLADALAQLGRGGEVWLISDDAELLPDLAADRRMRFVAATLDGAALVADEVADRLLPYLTADPAPLALVVDMTWALASRQGVSELDVWGSVAERLARESGVPVVSLYHRDLTIEEQMQAAFRAHRQYLAPSGLYENPYWLPSALRDGAPLDEQLSFLLGRVVPEHEGLLAHRRAGQMNARGTTPSWLAKPRSVLGSPPAQARWHIRCLGQLRVHVGDRLVDWQIKGSTPKKTRALFAYLLQSGEKGAHAEQLGELLWSEGHSEEVKRARLHHTVAMLRKTLGDAGAVIRSGEYYRLNPPAGSWIDIDSFEQLCRRGLSLFKRGEDELALRLYHAADLLYGGDLFEDLPLEYVHSETNDWCMPRRIWLREMQVKLQYDFAKVLLRSKRTREALEHCQKSLGIDPASEGANAVAMRIFMAQGRVDAMHRQYRQYKAAVAAMGAGEGAEIRGLYRDLSKELSVPARI